MNTSGKKVSTLPDVGRNKQVDKEFIEFFGRGVYSSVS